MKIVSEFIDLLKSSYGENLVSVILYGSAASGEYSKQNSNIDIAVILKDASLPVISKPSALFSRRRFAIINPVFFTEDYIKRSADVFPIEFTDIKENHRVLYGMDLFKDIAIDTKNLRFQCEQEIKSKIINIKRAYFKTTDRGALNKLLFRSITSALHILRNVIRLKGKEPSYTKEEILNEIAREFAVDTAPLKKILGAKNRDLKLKYNEMSNLFTCLVAILEVISDKIDRL